MNKIYKNEHNKPTVGPTETSYMPSIAFLPKKISKKLKITRVPTSEPIPLIVGHYWNCQINEHNFEICRIKLVVCNDDQSFCVEVN